MHDPILYTAGMIRQHLSEVSFGITAVTLVIVGPKINGFVLQAMQRFHWLVRYLAFVVLCTAGYGILTQALYRNLKHWLAGRHGLALVAVTLVIYLVLAFFARKQGHI